MDGFKNIEIKNFRGIDHLKINDLSRVNVFVGQNNSGKSSILEAIHLLTGMSNPDMPLNLNRIRTRNYYSNFKDIFYLFHNMDVKTSPEFFAKQMDDDERILRLKMTYVFNEQELASQTNPMNGMPPVSETKTFLNTLEMNFEKWTLLAPLNSMKHRTPSIKKCSRSRSVMNDTSSCHHPSLPGRIRAMPVSREKATSAMSGGM